MYKVINKISICLTLCCILCNYFAIPVLALESTFFDEKIAENLKDGSKDVDFTYRIPLDKTLEIVYNKRSVNEIIIEYLQAKIIDEKYTITLDTKDKENSIYTIKEKDNIIYQGKFSYELETKLNITKTESIEETKLQIQEIIKKNLSIQKTITIEQIVDNQYKVTIEGISHIFQVVEQVVEKEEKENNQPKEATTAVITSEKFQDNSISISYSTHVQYIGWQDWKRNGETSGTEGESLRLEGIKVNVLNANMTGKIMYKTHVQNVGWQDWKTNGEISGTEGQSLRLEAIKIKLTDELEKNYDIYYSVHVQNMGWLGWAKNGANSGSAGYGYRLEGIKIKIVPKNEPFDVGQVVSYNEHAPLIYSNAHIQNMGWTGNAADRVTIGTEGYGLRMEALNLSIYSYGPNGGIEYSSHVQNIGWQDWKRNGEISGTERQSLRLEAIKIKLTGELADIYDIYYRTHVENYGWLDWAKNGEEAGSRGLFYRMEAIQIVLVKKGNPPPGPITRPMAQGKWVTQNGKTYYYDADGKMADDFMFIDGSKYFFNSLGVLIGSNVKKVIDVSAHNKTIDWDTVKKYGEIDGVILRVAAGSLNEDSMLERNIKALKRLNIPYGLYIYSYAENQIGIVPDLGTMHEGALEAQRVINSIKKYNMNLSFPIYLDLEVWENKRNSLWTVNNYRPIIDAFANKMQEYGYDFKIYTNKSWADTALNEAGIRNKIDWIAQYNHYCSYNGSYSGWQFSSKESIPGINGNVDVSVFFH